MKLLLVDDEPPARARLRELLEDIPLDIEVVGEAADGDSALAMCRNHQVDVVLMDIRMPGMDGLQAALALAAEPAPPAVIFTTAYDEHALAAFEANAVDYLLKPVRGERLAQALRKAQRLSEAQLLALAPEAAKDDAHIVASFRGGLSRIAVNDVYYLRADNKYVTVRHREGEILIEESLRSLEERFPDRWLRIHRNALVAPEQITELVRRPDGSFAVALRDTDEQLEISRRHLPAVRRWFRGGED